MSRKKILEESIRITMGDRQATHGSPQDTFEHIAKMWSAYLGEELQAEDVCHMMVLLKISRTQFGTVNSDDYVDMAGYSAIAGEIAGVNV